MLGVRGLIPGLAKMIISLFSYSSVIFYMNSTFKTMPLHAPVNIILEKILENF